MAHNWTSRVARRASTLGRVFRTTSPSGHQANDADTRRLRGELDAIRARFPDHA